MNSISNELEKWEITAPSIAKYLEKVIEKYSNAPTKVTPTVATIILHIMLCSGEIALPYMKD